MAEKKEGRESEGGREKNTERMQRLVEEKNDR